MEEGGSRVRPNEEDEALDADERLKYEMLYSSGVRPWQGSASDVTARGRGAGISNFEGHLKPRVCQNRVLEDVEVRQRQRAETVVLS